MEFLQQEKRAEYCIEALNLLAYSIKMNSDKSEDSIRKSIIFLQWALEYDELSLMTLFNLATSYFDI